MGEQAGAHDHDRRVDDDAWLERLRTAVSQVHDIGPAEALVDDRPGESLVVRTVSSAEVLKRLHDLDRRLTGIEDVLGRLPTDHRLDRLVTEVADAVVERLDARWTATAPDEHH